MFQPSKVGVEPRLHHRAQMTFIQTRRFGDLHYQDSSVLSFPWGLPGFEHCTRFTLVESADLAPVVFLQSLDLAELCFAAVRVSAIDNGYLLGVTTEDLDRLGLDVSSQPDSSEALTLAILCLAESGPLTANLLAPIVVNLSTRIAIQAVRADQRYSHQHPIPSEAEALCS